MIPREARNFGLGESTYYVVVLVVSAIMWQAFFLGAIGVIFCASSLLSGILIAVLLLLTEVLAVVFYKEKFQAEKGVSLVLSLWGFVSYFYGEIRVALGWHRVGWHWWHWPITMSQYLRFSLFHKHCDIVIGQCHQCHPTLCHSSTIREIKHAKAEKKKHGLETEKGQTLEGLPIGM